MLYLATMGLSIPLIMRGSLDIVRDFDEDFEQFTEKINPVAFNILFYIICDLLPLCFQLSSLIFGYIRRKHDKQRHRILNGAGTGHSEFNGERFLSDSQDSSNLSSHDGASQLQQSEIRIKSYFDPPLLPSRSSFIRSSIVSDRNGSQISNSEGSKDN